MTIKRVGEESMLLKLDASSVMKTGRDQAAESGEGRPDGLKKLGSDMLHASPDTDRIDLAAQAAAGRGLPPSSSSSSSSGYTECTCHASFRRRGA